MPTVSTVSYDGLLKANPEKGVFQRKKKFTICGGTSFNSTRVSKAHNTIETDRSKSLNLSPQRVPSIKMNQKQMWESIGQNKDKYKNTYMTQ